MAEILMQNDGLEIAKQKFSSVPAEIAFIERTAALIGIRSEIRSSRKLKVMQETLTQVHAELKNPGSGDLPHYLVASDIHGNVRRVAEMLRIAEEQHIDKIILAGS